MFTAFFTRRRTSAGAFLDDFDQLSAVARAANAGFDSFYAAEPNPHIKGEV
jgi:hypothetical protein